MASKKPMTTKRSAAKDEPDGYGPGMKTGKGKTAAKMKAVPSKPMKKAKSRGR